LADDLVEYRGKMHKAYIAVFDGLAIATGSNRTAVMDRALIAFAKAEMHKANVVIATTRGNPIPSDSNWSDLG
jgi:hypothetical protein